MARSKPWRDPIELPWLLGIVLPWFEVVAFIWLSIVFFWLPSGNAGFDRELRSVSVVVAVVALVASLFQKFAESWGTPAKSFVECVLSALSHELWRVDIDRLHGAKEKHRITLFRVEPRWLPFRAVRHFWRKVPNRPELPQVVRAALRTPYTHKIVPCMRVPASGKRPERSFYVNEHYDKYCEGVAGLIYAKGRLSTGALPDLHASNTTDDDFKRYADLTNDAVEKVRHYHYYSRRIAGTTVYVDGKRWGILVLDSTDLNAVDSGHLESDAMNRTLRILTAILEQELA